MTVPGAPAAAVDGETLAEPASPADGHVVDALVRRLHAEYGVERKEIHRQATEAFGGFATARVQTYVPLLVEKRLRATYEALLRSSR